MSKLPFTCDYMEGAHPRIMEVLMKNNMVRTAGYGGDEFCEEARETIRKVCEAPNAGVHFFVGGTQTNMTVIDSLLKVYEGVIAAKSGHVNTHEAGAIEFTGHKVLTIPDTNGKISAQQVADYCKTYYDDGNWEHVVTPGMVYISQPTEYGTLYSKKEMEDIKAVCQQYKMPLFVDGARLAYALACPENDVTLPDLARIADVFYIGGTKCGLLFGEAVVMPNPDLVPRFFSIMKQHGTVLAKGRLLGMQFQTMFEDGLYFEVGANAIKAATRIREILTEKGYKLVWGSPSNQVFAAIENSKIAELSEHIDMGYMEKYDENYTVMRFCTSWATRMEDVEALKEYL